MVRSQQFLERRFRKQGLDDQFSPHFPMQVVQEPSLKCGNDGMHRRWHEKREQIGSKAKISTTRSARTARERSGRVKYFIVGRRAGCSFFAHFIPFACLLAVHGLALYTFYTLVGGRKWAKSDLGRNDDYTEKERHALHSVATG